MPRFNPKSSYRQAITAWWAPLTEFVFPSDVDDEPLQIEVGEADYWGHLLSTETHKKVFLIWLSYGSGMVCTYCEVDNERGLRTPGTYEMHHRGEQESFYLLHQLRLVACGYILDKCSMARIYPRMYIYIVLTSRPWKHIDLIDWWQKLWRTVWK